MNSSESPGSHYSENQAPEYIAKKQKKHQHSGIVLYLQGGIGNQLFVYFAGVYLNQRIKSHLKLNYNLVEAGIILKHECINNFELSESLFNRVKVPKTKNRIGTKIIYKIGRIHNFFARGLFRLSKIVISDKIGFDEQLLSTKCLRGLMGYFQTDYYYDNISDKNQKRVELRNPSGWYKNELSMLIEIQPVGIHIRRGDYENHKHTIGVLGELYYLNAIAKLKELEIEGPIWVFSDDIEKARAIFVKHRIKVDRFISPPPKIFSGESLLLMSKCKALIIANSTFSWWAAKLSDNSSAIIVPSKWFRGLDDPERILSTSWHQTPSYWED